MAAGLGSLLNSETVAQVIGERLDRLYYRPLSSKLHVHAHFCPVSRCPGEKSYGGCSSGIAPTCHLAEKWLRFQCISLPASTMTSYIRTLWRNTKCTGESLVLAAGFVEQCADLWQDLDPSTRLSSYCIHRLFLAVFILSIKMHEDSWVPETLIARAGGVPIEELIGLEQLVLSLLSYDLLPTVSDYPRIYQHVLLIEPDSHKLHVDIKLWQSGAPNLNRSNPSQPTNLTASLPLDTTVESGSEEKFTPKLRRDVAIHSGPSLSAQNSPNEEERKSRIVILPSLLAVESRYSEDIEIITTAESDANGRTERCGSSDDAGAGGRRGSVDGAGGGRRGSVDETVGVGRRGSIDSRRGSIDETAAPSVGPDLDFGLGRRGSIGGPGSRRGSFDATQIQIVSSNKPPPAPRGAAPTHKAPFGPTPHPLGAAAFTFGAGSLPGSAQTSPINNKSTTLAAAILAAKQRDLSNSIKPSARLSKPIPIPSLKAKARSQSMNDDLLASRKPLGPLQEMAGMPARRTCSWTAGGVVPAAPPLGKNSLRRTASFAAIPPGLSTSLGKVSESTLMGYSNKPISLGGCTRESEAPFGTAFAEKLGQIAHSITSLTGGSLTVPAAPTLMIAKSSLPPITAVKTVASTGTASACGSVMTTAPAKHNRPATSHKVTKPNRRCCFASTTPSPGPSNQY